MKEEKEVTWSLVVESDEIHSKATGRWHEVIGTVLATDGSGRIKIHVKGFPRAIIKNGDDPVRVRRGATGRVVDMFAVIFSGPTGRDSEVTNE